jgi:hypothetical protein
MRREARRVTAESVAARVVEGEASGSLSAADGVSGEGADDGLPSLLRSPSESAPGSADTSPLASLASSSASRKRSLATSTEVPMRARRRLSPAQPDTDAEAGAPITTQEDADAVNLFLSVVTAIRE